jgi:ankyrin repeat protein
MTVWHALCCRACSLPACCCLSAQVMLLVEEGGADLSAKDRWGATPLDEAQRVGAADVAAYLSSSKAAQAAAAARAALAARQGSSNRYGAQL